MTTLRQFEGKVVMVTGAGTGIGADTAFLLAERGAKVVIVGRREAPLHEVEQRIVAAGGEVLVAVADVSDIAQVEKVLEKLWKVRSSTLRRLQCRSIWRKL
jgi:NADP-dependent 3-hydroxy acid dehydrogenase YdfG